MEETCRSSTSHHRPRANGFVRGNHCQDWRPSKAVGGASEGRQDRAFAPKPHDGKREPQRGHVRDDDERRRWPRGFGRGGGRAAGFGALYPLSVSRGRRSRRPSRARDFAPRLAAGGSSSPTRGDGLHHRAGALPVLEEALARSDDQVKRSLQDRKIVGALDHGQWPQRGFGDKSAATSPESTEVLDNGEVKLALGMSKTDPTCVCATAGGS